MKKSSLILAIIFLISVSSFQGLVAQEKTKAEKEKELSELIDAQKKAMVDQQKAQEEVKKAMEQTKDEQKKAQADMHDAMEEVKHAYDDAMKNAKFNVLDSEKFHKSFRIYQDFAKNRSFPFSEPFAFTPGGDFFGHFNGEGENTLWDFSKSIKESSFSREYTFDVDLTANTVVMAVNGDCKSGTIHIKITMPDGKIYSDILIDESGDLNWRKSFSVSDTENKDKTGAWKFEINSLKATGFFKISLQIY